MEVRNCRSCGRLFNYLGGMPICPDCTRKLEDTFQAVKEYLRENPKAPVSQVSEEMDVSVKQIKQWVREERLSFSGTGADGFVCEHCGAPITTGRFCEKCKSNMTDSLNEALDKPKPAPVKKQEKDGNRMRFLQ